MTNAALSTNPPVPDDEKHSWRGAFNTQAPAIMRDMFPPAAYATASQQHYGARGEWRVTVLPANQAGSWRNMITGAEGPFFSQMIGVLFNEPEPQALVRMVRWDNGNGKGSDKNRLAVILKHDLDNEWQSRWEQGQPIPSGKLCKTIRSYWGTDLSFAGDTSHVLRSGDSENKLMALHRDPLSNCPVGLSVRGSGLGADISFGNLTAPIKLHEHEKIENRLNLALDLRTGLQMLQAYRPLWVVQDYAKVELPKGVTIVGMAINRVPGDYALIKHLTPIYASRGVTIHALEPENSDRWAA